MIELIFKKKKKCRRACKGLAWASEERRCLLALESLLGIARNSTKWPTPDTCHDALFLNINNGIAV